MMAFALEKELVEDERIVWQGRPDPNPFILTRADVLRLPIAAVWSWTASHMNVDFWQLGYPISWKLLAILFLCISIYITIGRFFHSSLRRKSIRYALTNRRAIIWHEGERRKVKEYPLAASTHIEFRPARFGTIIFGRLKPMIFSHHSIGIWYDKYSDFRFQFLEGSLAVYQNVLKIQGDRP